MSMRLFTEQDFINQLKTLGFNVIDDGYANCMVVSFEGESYTLRKGRDTYPDFFIDEIMRHIRADGEYIEPCKSPAIYKVQPNDNS